MTGLEKRNVAEKVENKAEYDDVLEPPLGQIPIDSFFKKPYKRDVLTLLAVRHGYFHEDDVLQERKPEQIDDVALLKIALARLEGFPVPAIADAYGYWVVKDPNNVPGNENITNICTYFIKPAVMKVARDNVQRAWNTMYYRAPRKSVIAKYRDELCEKLKLAPEKLLSAGRAPQCEALQANGARFTLEEALKVLQALTVEDIRYEDIATRFDATPSGISRILKETFPREVVEKAKELGKLVDL